MSANTKVYECLIEVRGYEIDGYKHVNNAVYLNYLEHARWKMLEEEGLSYQDLDTWKRWPVVVRTEIQYFKPAFMGNQLLVKTRMSEATRTSFTFEQTIEHNNVILSKSKTQCVFINEQGCLTTPPERMVQIWGPTS